MRYKDKRCVVEECSKGLTGRGLCAAHYRRLRLYGDPLKAKNYTGDGIPVHERFWSKVERLKASDCWLWTGCKDREGYGLFWYSGTTVRSSRVAWMLTSQRETELKILHECDNPPCCNPNHLKEGTQKENIYDMISKGRAFWQKGDKK